MRLINSEEMAYVSGGITGTATATVVCTQSKTTNPNGSVTETRTCAATTTVKVE